MLRRSMIVATVSNFRPDIWRLQANADIQGLIKALEDADSGLRRPAAAALRALSAVEAIPVLKRVLDQEHDPETRSAVLAALAALELALRDASEDKPATPVPPNAHQQAVEALVAQMGGTDPKQVVTAALRLAKLKDMRCVEPLIVQFSNRAVPAKVRLMIAEALLELESATGDVALLGALRNPKESIRRSAAMVLGQLGADWAVEPLANALKDESAQVQQAAQVALSNINTPDARAAGAAYAKMRTATNPVVNPAVNPATTTTTVTAEHPAVMADTDEADAAGYAGPQDGLLRYIKGQASADETAKSEAETKAESSSTDTSDSTSKESRGNVLIIRPNTPDAAAVPEKPEEGASDTPQKLSWPKRDTSQQESISTMVTRPLNPGRVKEIQDDARDRLDARTDDAG